MSTQTWRKGLVASAALLALLLTAGLLWPTSKASGDGDGGVSNDVINALTVTSVSVNCPDVVNSNGGSTVADKGQTLVVFNNHIGALKGTPPRLWSDALSTPYGNTEPQKILEETQATICMDPLYGSTVAHFFATMSVGNVNVVDLNPWLKPFAGDASQINHTAAGYMPLLDVTNPSSEQKQQAVTQNVAWQHVADKLGTLLTRFNLGEVKSAPSVLNYHLVAGGLAVGGLPAVGINPHQESLPALQLNLTEKGACAPLKIIGLNTGDKRPEEFTPPTCEKPKQPPSTPTTTPPTTPPPPGKIRVCRPGVGIIDIRKDERRNGDTTDLSKCVPPPTTPPTTPPPTTPPPTQPPCSSGKCTPPTTVAPPPTTTPPPTTAPPNNGGQGDSGDGATNTTSPPTTESPAPAPDNTSPPSSNPPPPPG